MFLRKLVLFVALVFLNSCEVTKALWEDGYKETIGQFLVSKNGQYVVFLGKNYHYIFNDQSGIINELLSLDRDHVVLIDTKNTELEVDGKNNVYGHIAIKTFDLNLSSEQRMLLFSLGFKKEKQEDDLILKLHLEGKRYRGFEPENAYYLALKDQYEIEIRHRPTPIREFKKVALTPLTIMADTIFFSKDVLETISGE